MLSSDSRLDLEQQQVIQSLSLRVRMLEALLENLPGKIQEQVQALSDSQSEQELRLQNVTGQMQVLEESVELVLSEAQDWRYRFARSEEIENLPSIYSADGEPVCNYTESNDYRTR